MENDFELSDEEGSDDSESDTESNSDSESDEEQGIYNFSIFYYLIFQFILCIKYFVQSIFIKKRRLKEVFAY